MKLTQATLKAVRGAKIQHNAKVAAKSAKSKKQNKAKAQVKVALKVKSRQIAVALLSGERGHAARLVEHLTYTDGQQSIRALQDNKGLAMKTGTAAMLDGGKITSKADKQARIELGGYVNGRNTGARVELLTPQQFDKRSGKALVHWAADDNGIHGRYIGNPNVKGMVAVAVDYKGGAYYWQMEQDSNTNNKHERGAVKPITKDGKLIATK